MRSEFSDNTSTFNSMHEQRRKAPQKKKAVQGLPSAVGAPEENVACAGARSRLWWSFKMHIMHFKAPPRLMPQSFYEWAREEKLKQCHTSTRTVPSPFLYPQKTLMHL